MIKGLIVLQMLWIMVGDRGMAELNRIAPTKPALFGLYEVTSFTRNAVVHPPLLTDSVRWRRVAIDERNLLTLMFMDETRRVFRVRAGTKPDKLVLESMTPGAVKRTSDFKLTRLSANELMIEGMLGDGNLTVRLRRADDSKFLLSNRGFHWINEQPFNR